MDFDNNHVTIDLDAIAHNFDAVCHKRTATVMAVVKADAYGHGAVPVARLLTPKCGFFGVSSLAEALELRYAGIQTPILILGRTPAGSFPKAVAKDIRPTIFHYEGALALSDEAV